MKDWRWLASEVKRGAFPNFEELALDHFECGHMYACTYKLRGKIDMDVLKKSKTTWFNMDLVTSCKTADRMRTLLAMFLKLGVSCRLMNYDEVLEQAREKKRSDDEYMSEHCRYRMEEEGWLDEDAKAWKAFKKDDISSSSDDSSDEDDSNDEDDDQSGHELEDESDGSGFDSESDDYVGYGNYSRDRQNFASSLAMMRNGGYFGMG
ncbi:hypothetical protein CH063_07772 [Colletotrichum higginsianum]|nr:hypothetical protein CH35J_008790 [Colletotrichum higginsianum]CCF36138.1 hypothetical protein CH063_07772 [Colletotrichum higginsianum]